MAAIRFIAEGDGCWPDVGELRKAGRLFHSTRPFEVAYLPGGMQSGAPSLTFRFELGDGYVLMAETSVAAFEALAAAVRGRKERG